MKPSKRELEALVEIGGLLGRDNYWWRQSSMRKLEVLGFVKKRAGQDFKRVPSWEITDAGREHLRGMP